MTETKIVTCDQGCGAKARTEGYGDLYEDGWLSVFDNHHDDGLDFCSVQCMVDFYTGEEPTVE